MVTRRILAPALVGCAALALLILPAQARAGLLTVTISETGAAGSPITIVDGGTGDLDGIVNNSILASSAVSGNMGSFSWFLTASSNNPGNAAIGTLSLNPNTTRLDGANSNPLLVTASQTGFSLPGGASTVVKFTSTLAVSGITGNLTDSVGLASMIDATSTPPQSVTAPSGTDVKSLTYVRGATYSLSTTSTDNLLSINDNAVYSATLTVASAIPAPGGLVLLLTGAPLVVGSYLRRRQKVAVA
jgi:hypothetical protein